MNALTATAATLAGDAAAHGIDGPDAYGMILDVAPTDYAGLRLLVTALEREWRVYADRATLADAEHAVAVAAAEHALSMAFAEGDADKIEEVRMTNREAITDAEQAREWRYSRARSVSLLPGVARDLMLDAQISEQAARDARR